MSSNHDGLGGTLSLVRNYEHNHYYSERKAQTLAFLLKWSLPGLFSIQDIICLD